MLFKQNKTKRQVKDTGNRENLRCVNLTVRYEKSVLKRCNRFSFFPQNVCVQDKINNPVELYDIQSRTREILWYMNNNGADQYLIRATKNPTT